MSDYTPICRHSLAEAKRCNQLDVWKESHKENCACARAIEKAVQQGFDGMHLQGDCAKAVIEEFGMNRVCYVLANTIQEKYDDGRFSPTNRRWAERCFIPDDSHNYLFVVSSHPAVLDGFVTQTRNAWQELGMLDTQHCQPDSHSMDYTGKVLVVDPFWLKEKYQTPEYQLFLASAGFGCSPTAIGRKVFGTFLFDGENTNLDRSDFLGVLKDEHLPDWAREKLEPQTIQEETPAVGQTM